MKKLANLKEDALNSLKNKRRKGIGDINGNIIENNDTMDDNDYEESEE